jgi:hypothetical protein
MAIQITGTTVIDNSRKFIPELVETGDDGLKRVNYSNMIGLLIEAIKEQQVRIEELERKSNA